MRVAVRDDLHVRRPAARGERAIGVSPDHLLMRNLSAPRGEGNVQAANLRRWKPLDGVDRVPVLHEAAALAGEIHAGPASLRIAAPVDATQRHVGQLDWHRVLEAQRAALVASEPDALT